LQAQLLKAQTDLRLAREELSELLTELCRLQSELRYEQETNKIAQEFIPEEMHTEYFAEWPNRQF